MNFSKNSTKSGRGKTSATYVLLLLLYFVFLDESSDNFILNASSRLYTYEVALAVILLILQIIFSPLQAGFSDYYLRKKSLIVSLSATLISLFLFKLSSFSWSFLVFFSIILKGILGNTLPIAWAGIADVTKPTKFRFALALSICALAIGSWGTLISIPHLSINLTFYIIVILFILAEFLIIFIFRDLEDTHTAHFKQKKTIVQLVKDECVGIYYLSIKPLNILAITSFFFSEICFYQILFRVEVLKSLDCLKYIPISIGIGYTIGTVALKFVNAKDKLVSSCGIVLNMLTILSIFILALTNYLEHYYFILLFSIFSFGYAFFTPALFSLITPRSHPHLIGKIYGILESVDSLASLVSFVLVFSFHSASCSIIFGISLFMNVFAMFFFLKLLAKARNKT